MSKARQDAIAEVLRTQARDADDPPDVELHRDVDKDRGDDRKREGRAELGRELRQATKPGPIAFHQQHRLVTPD